jgi:subtilisin family serine protease
MSTRLRATRTTLTAIVAILGALIFGGVVASPPGAGGGGAADPDSLYAPHVPGELLVRFKSQAGPSERAGVRAQVAAQKIHEFRTGAERWRLGSGQGVGQAIARLRGNPHVAYAEPNYIVNLELAPNDPRYTELWGLNNAGQTGGTAGADIDAERAWNVSTGSPAVVVAVIDTGIDYNHPDLFQNIWINQGEIPANGVDDDNNGFIDDVRGWDFVNDDNNPFDDNGHGTHVSGTIGAVGNNGIGVAGVSWRVSLMGLKFLSAAGSGTTADAVDAIEYATMMGADIMSNSWGGGGFSQTLLDAINAAAGAEIVFVAAAGNGGADGIGDNNDTTPHYPSNYDAPNVIAVAATDHNDARAVFSNFGPTSVDLGAPGVSVLSTLPGNSYGLLSGTSMATPHVSGAAALVRSVAPNTSAALVRQLLLNFADDIQSLQGITVSGGRLNAFFPIAEPDDTPPGAIVDLATTAATSNSLFLQWTATGDDGMQGTASTYDVRYSTSPIDDGNFAMATKAVGAPVPQPSGATESMEVLGLDAGAQYYFAVKAGDEWGNAGALSNIAVGTTLPPPTFASDPDSFQADLLTGQSTTRMLTIQNAGVGTLDWRIPLPSVSGPVMVQHEPLELDKEEPDPRPGIPALEGFGGPDAFGYRWIDSDEPGGPAFSWMDIGMSGTPIAGLDGDDEISAPIPLGFNFSFYGNTFDSVRVSTNGWISFTSTVATGTTAYSNQPLPNSAAPENLLAAFWDDLHFRGALRAAYLATGDSFIVQYTEVDRYTTGSTLTFQAELRATGEIRFRYLNMAGVLNSATIGIQNATKTDGLTVVFNSDYIHDDLEIRIAAVPQWLTAAPTSGRLFGGQSQEVTVTIDASGLDGGTYEGMVNVQTNDPQQPLVGHPVTLGVTGAPAIGVMPAALDFGQVFLGFSRTLDLRINNTGTDTLTVGSIASGDPQVTVAPALLAIPAHAGATVQVTYAPSGPGTLATTLVVTSDASNAPELTVPVAGSAAPAPVVLVEPASFSETLYTGGMVTRNLRVRNTGGSNLIVNLSADLGSVQQPPPGEQAEVAKGDESANGTGDPVTERQGGPDAFGYRYRDSDEPGGPAFGWVDISSIGTPITFASFDDSNAGPIPIGFDFPFYGNTFNTLRACTNGWLSFTSTSTSLSNTMLPTGGTTLPNNLLAVFWDDLHFRSVQRARYHNDGTRFIVQYTMVDRFTTGSNLTFQVILYPSGRIVYQYLSMSGVLNSATIGIQNATRDIGLTVAHNAAYVHDSLAIAFEQIPEWLRAAPASGTIPAGGHADVVLDLDAAGLEDGDYDATVRISSNDPFHSPIDVPVRLHAGQVDLAYIDVDPNTLNLTSQGRFVRGALQLPEEYDPHDIVLSSVSIDHQVHALPSPVSYEDTNGDGVIELVVMFDRAAFEAIVPEGDSVPVTVTGEVRDTTWFTGTDHIRTIHPQIGHPNGGEYLIAGATARITWSAPVLAAPRDYDVWLSRDGGATWEVLAGGVRGTSVDWVVSGPTTTDARVRVLAMDNRGVMGYDTSDATFTIAAALQPPNPVDTLRLGLDADAVRLQWQRPATDLVHGPAEAYRVLRAFGVQGAWEEIGLAGVESFSDPLAAHGDQPLVLYKVVAINAAGGAE